MREDFDAQDSATKFNLWINAAHFSMNFTSPYYKILPVRESDKCPVFIQQPEIMTQGTVHLRDEVKNLPPSSPPSTQLAQINEFLIGVFGLLVFFPIQHTGPSTTCFSLLAQSYLTLRTCPNY